MLSVEPGMVKVCVWVDWDGDFDEMGKRLDGMPHICEIGLNPAGVYVLLEFEDIADVSSGAVEYACDRIRLRLGG
jgi:hypothetical protein